jgi:hypothetical protein
MLPRIESNLPSLNRSNDISQQLLENYNNKPIDREYGEFTVSVKDCRLVYKRLNNNSLNSYSRNGKCYCSIFIDKTFVA